MKTTLRGVIVGEPLLEDSNKEYPAADGRMIKRDFVNMYLHVNELPEAENQPVNRWRIPVFAGRNPRLQLQTQRDYTNNRENFSKGTHFVELDVIINPSRGKSGNPGDDRNSFAGVSLMGPMRVVPAGDSERDLVHAALKIESIERD